MAAEMDEIMELDRRMDAERDVDTDLSEHTAHQGLVERPFDATTMEDALEIEDVANETARQVLIESELEGESHTYGDHCPVGHSLHAWKTSHEGVCNACGLHIPAAHNVMDCRACNWYVCEGCSADKAQPQTWIRSARPRETSSGSVGSGTGEWLQKLWAPYI